MTGFGRSNIKVLVIGIVSEKLTRAKFSRHSQEIKFKSNHSCFKDEFEVPMGYLVEVLNKIPNIPS